MLSFNKEEAHNLIKEKRIEGKFATTEVDTRGYYLGHWQPAQNCSSLNWYLRMFSSSGVQGT